MLEFLFNKVTDLKACNFFKKRLWHRCFPVKFAKFSGTPFTEHLWWLLLKRVDESHWAVTLYQSLQNWFNHLWVLYWWCCSIWHFVFAWSLLTRLPPWVNTNAFELPLAVKIFSWINGLTDVSTWSVVDTGDTLQLRLSIENEVKKMNNCLWLCDKIYIGLFTLFYKQPVYKQLAIRWEIVKQFSGLNPFSISSNKNYGLKESGVFPL